MPVALPSLHVFFRIQALCVVLAVLVGAFFWAIGQAINPATVLIYSLLLGNLSLLVTQSLRHFYDQHPFPYNWLLFLLLVLLMLAPLFVTASVAVWWIAPPSPQPFWHLIRTGWKTPFLIIFLVCVLTYLYQGASEKMERRNRELQNSVKEGAARLEIQEQELLRAREIQQSLLPKEIPQLPGFEVAGAWRPAQTVSGDYYDVFKLDGHRLGICIADVVGKGVSAALLMANVQAAVRAFADISQSPAQLCAKVNKLLCENLATGKFVSFLYGVLDGEAHTMEYCNAGHLYPILVSGGVTRELDLAGAVLGVFPSWNYEDAKFELKPGDRLLVFTDGITEAENADEQEFGEEKVAAVARACKGRTAAEMNAMLLERVSSYCQNHFRDDATLLVVAAI
jgi:phosphoserine phosphatase RsbU/P